MGEINYKICKRCVMDTSDPSIKFTDEGICDNCIQFDKITKKYWFEKQNDKEGLNNIISKIKSSRIGKYDCILGLSGGVDSSYLLHYSVKKLGLNPLVFHVDGGWNSNISVSNIKSLISELKLDLFTEVINWEEMRTFQLAFFKSGLPHLDTPQDHAFIATLYNYANKNGIKWILNGGNISTECIRNPLKYFYYGTDMKQINFIRKKFGAKYMPTYPFSSIIRHKIWLRYIKRVKVLKILDYIEYNKKVAQKELVDNYGWKPYPRKHFESRFTRYFEGYWLPSRFGFDTRRVQFSSLILTNQLTRQEALLALEKPEFDESEALSESKFVAKKLKISLKELMHYKEMPKKYFYDYPNSENFFRKGANFLQKFGLEAGIKR
jgi:N-acetyl sugar amidotransferase